MDSGVITWKCRDTYVEMAAMLTGEPGQSIPAYNQTARSLIALLRSAQRSRDVLSCLPATPTEYPTLIQQLQPFSQRVAPSMACTIS